MTTTFRPGLVLALPAACVLAACGGGGGDEGADGGVERAASSASAGRCIDRYAPPAANELFAARACD